MGRCKAVGDAQPINYSVFDVRQNWQTGTIRSAQQVRLTLEDEEGRDEEEEEEEEAKEI